MTSRLPTEKAGGKKRCWQLGVLSLPGITGCHAPGQQRDVTQGANLGPQIMTAKKHSKTLSGLSERAWIQWAWSLIDWERRPVPGKFLSQGGRWHRTVKVDAMIGIWHYSLQSTGAYALLS